MPIGVTGIGRETEEHLVAVVVVPVEGSIPAVGHGIFAIFTIDNFLCYCSTFIIFLLADIHFGIEVETHQKGCGTGFCPLALDRGVGAQARFLDEHGYCLLQFRLDKLEYSLRLHLCLGVLRHIIVAHGERHVAESIEQTNVEPGTQHPALSFQVVKFSLGKTKLFRRKGVEVFYHIVGLHDALKASVPFCLWVTTVFHVPLMIVQAAPFAPIVPPTVASGSDELVGRQFVEHMSALYAPESMFKWAEGGTDDVHLRVVVVLCAHLVVKRLVEVGATRHCGCTQCRRD